MKILTISALGAAFGVGVVVAMHLLFSFVVWEMVLPRLELLRAAAVAGSISVPISWMIRR